MTNTAQTMVKRKQARTFVFSRVELPPPGQGPNKARNISQILAMTDEKTKIYP